MDISFLTALNQEKADENDLHNIVKISDRQTRAFALIAYGNDAMNRGDFTVAIDAFLHAGNCSEYGSAAYLNGSWNRLRKGSRRLLQQPCGYRILSAHRPQSQSVSVLRPGVEDR